jgi:hypothetical protein
MFDVDEINKEIPYKISLKDYEDFSFMTNKNYQKKEEVENIFDCHSLDFWDCQ